MKLRKGLEFDFTSIDCHLRCLSNKQARLTYLRNQLIEVENQLTDLNTFDGPDLKRLIQKTERDYKILTDEQDKGFIIMFTEENNDWSKETNEKIARRLGIENYKLLLRRMELENQSTLLGGLIHIIGRAYSTI
jgi:hypothetical protein